MLLADVVQHLTNCIRHADTGFSISNFERSVLGRIDDDFCDQIRVGRLLTRSTRSAFYSWPEFFRSPRIFGRSGLSLGARRVCFLGNVPLLFLGGNGGLQGLLGLVKVLARDRLELGPLELLLRLLLSGGRVLLRLGHPT